MSRFIFVAALGLIGCSEPNKSGRSYIAPLDGQTGVPLDMPLVVETGGLDVPDDYPVAPDQITVIDIDRGGFVDGAVVRAGDQLVFTPDDPWAPARRYLWTVNQLDADSHTPETLLDKKLLGSALFETDTRIALLGATQDPELGELCGVFSRPLRASDQGAITFTVDDQTLPDPVIQVVDDERWNDQPYVLPEGDPGAAVMCIESTLIVEAGASVRMWWGDLGPWHARVESAPVREVVGRLRRDSAVQAAEEAE